MNWNIEEKETHFYMRFNDDSVTHSEEVAPGLAVDYSPEKNVVGLTVQKFDETAEATVPKPAPTYLYSE